MKVQLSKRRLIPRWRRVAATLSLPEGQAKTKRLGSPKHFQPEELSRAIAEWKLNPTSGHLGSVLAFSVHPEALGAVLEVVDGALQQGNSVTIAQGKLVDGLKRNFIEDTKPERELSACNTSVQARVREIRDLLRVNPRSPLALLDYAQLQLAVGNHRHAYRSIATALSLAPQSRIVLRTAARFYVHCGEADRAHLMIARHENTKSDPWLMATEIATSQAAGVGSKFAALGSKLAREKRKRYTNYTELAGAVAGLEMMGGSWKRARELFRVALLSPNDNVIAQAVTDQPELKLDLSAPDQRQVALGTPEARMLISWRALDPASAEREALLWHAEEPFSGRPLQFLSALYAVQGQYESVVRIAKRGLIVDPRDAVLFANLSYGHASLGNLAEAERAASRVRSLTGLRMEPQLLATQGLMEMQRGNFMLSDELYSSAIGQFEAKGDAEMVGICYAYFARAAVELSHPRTESLLASAVAAFKISPSVDAAIVLKSCLQHVTLPEEDNSAHALVRWVYDRRTNSLIRRDELGDLGAGAFSIKDDNRLN